jgi:soluble lytic murein transglycosylase
MNSAHKRHFWRYGILLHRHQIWLSELVSIFFVAGLLAVLFSITFLIVHNNSRIRTQSQRIVRLTSEQAELRRTLDEVNERERIFRGAIAVFGRTVPMVTMYHVVNLVHKNSRTYGYDPLLVLAVIHVESRFNAQALGKYRDGQLSGALGLMQLKFETAQEVARDLDIELASKEDLFKPEINLVLGLGYLTRMIAKFRNFKLGLLAYNQGPGVVIDNLDANAELSIRYYNKVLKSYFRLKKMVDSGKAI